jgi:hypothetical protein
MIVPFNSLNTADLVVDEEVIADGHPILIISATDIAQVLRSNSIRTSNIDEWLLSLEQNDIKRTRQLR